MGLHSRPLPPRSGKGTGAITLSDPSVAPVADVPYRGISSFRYGDRSIFFGRDAEARRLSDLVTVYRGVMVYGDSGVGKSSLVNAGLLPLVKQRRFNAMRARVQPRLGEEVVIEPVRDVAAEEHPGAELEWREDASTTRVLSLEELEARLIEAAAQDRAWPSLLVFDQFEEIVTLFDEPRARGAQRELVALLVRLLRKPLPIKIVLVFREDYLGKIRALLDSCPELVDQSLRVAPLTVAALPGIIRGPFERFPGHFARELSPELARRIEEAFTARSGSGEISLSEVQMVCLRLWQSSDPAALLDTLGVQGVLEQSLGEALDHMPPHVRTAATALLGQMVTASGTRNVVSAADLIARTRAEQPISPVIMEQALEQLELSRLIRRERRRDLDLYELASEFLIPWINRRRTEAELARSRRRERRRTMVLGQIVGLLLLMSTAVAALAIFALDQRSRAEREARTATSLALLADSSAVLSSKPKVALSLSEAALAPYGRLALAPAGTRTSILAALEGSATPLTLRPTVRHPPPTLSVAYSRDGRLLAAASADGAVRLWSSSGQTNGPPLSSPGSPINIVAFNPAGDTLAAAGVSGTVSLWDPTTHRLQATLVGHTSPVLCLAFSPDGRTLASGSSDGTIRLWDASGRRLITLPRTGTAPVSSVAWSPDGRILASGSSDGIIRLSDQSGRLLRVLRSVGGIDALVFTADGRTLVSGGEDQTIRLWDVGTGRRLGAPLIGHLSSVTSLALSHDGRTLLSGSADHTVRLWDMISRLPIGAPLVPRGGPVNSVAFSPDGRDVATATNDGVVRVWPRLLWHSPADLQREVCGIIGHGLDPLTWTEYAPGLAYRRVCRNPPPQTNGN